jgi:alkanesulfonate monooxygenase SsuD/methylene tetrahydromethanopterin reductase-like flavin-dependent oxidoreductase (luciferase family)
LVSRFGLLDYLGDRFAVAGTASECAARLQRMAAAGADHVFTMLDSRDASVPDRFVTDVLPRLKV